MRPASTSILSAVERTDVGEDRLTEVLACVAQVNQDFAEALVDMAGAEKGERYAVGTQRLTPSGRRVDMEIATYRGLARAGLVWVEVKAGAIYQPNQLQDYTREVRDPVRGEPTGRVLTIIPPGDKPVEPTDGLTWESRTWSEVALAADRLGRGHFKRPTWRDAAMEPTTQAKWRYLAELIRHIEQKGYARMQPLNVEDVIAASRLANVKRTLEDLVKGASGIPGVNRDGLQFKGQWTGCYQIFNTDERKWFDNAERYGNAYPELHYRDRDEWTADQVGAPAFCAGVTFYDVSTPTRQALENSDWQQRLPSGVTVGYGDGLLRLVRTMYLSELIVKGATFELQAQALNEWASDAIRTAMDEVEEPPFSEPVSTLP